VNSPRQGSRQRGWHDEAPIALAENIGAASVLPLKLAINPEARTSIEHQKSLKTARMRQNAITSNPGRHFLGYEFTEAVQNNTMHQTD
jgi:hypothetical protein